MRFCFLTFCCWICVSASAQNRFSESKSDSCEHKFDYQSNKYKIDVSIEVPCSWTLRDQPGKTNTLATFSTRSPESFFYSQLILTPFDDSMDSKGISFFLEDENLTKVAGKVGTIESVRRLKINNLDAGEVIYNSSTQVNGVSVYTSQLTYFIYSYKTALQVNFAIGAKSDVERKKQFDILLPLVRSAVNSIILK